MNEFIKRCITGFFLALGYIYAVFFTPPWVFAGMVVLIFGIIINTEWPRLFHYKSLSFWLLMPLYLIGPLSLIIQMQLEGYAYLNFILVSMVAAHDTGSYITGKLWGKHKIAPSISPGKTWEGLLGGIIITFCSSLFFFGLKAALIPFSFTVSVLAFLGDLFESYLKRRAHLKDSGTLLPGHGGILDRIDAVLFVAPLFYFLRHYLHFLLTF